MTEHLEIRRNDDGTIDEVIAKRVALVHVEQMDDGYFWMGMDFTDGRRWTVHFHSDAPIAVRVEEE